MFHSASFLVLSIHLFCFQGVQFLVRLYICIQLPQVCSQRTQTKNMHGRGRSVFCPRIDGENDLNDAKCVVII